MVLHHCNGSREIRRPKDGVPTNRRGGPPVGKYRRQTPSVRVRARPGIDERDATCLQEACVICRTSALESPMFKLEGMASEEKKDR